MDLLDLRYLVVAVETGNLSRAADAIGSTPSTISRRLNRLEDELGVTVLERGVFGVRPTAIGHKIMVQVRRALESVEDVLQAGRSGALGRTGTIRLGVRMPPIGEPLQSMLSAWHAQNPDIVLTLHELNDNELYEALAERTLDAALVTTHTLRRGTNSVPIYREKLIAAIPLTHRLAEHDTLTWDLLREQTILTQGWDNSHSARLFYASFLGPGMKCVAHAASKQSVMALVGAGFGVTLAVTSQSAVAFPGVIYKTIADDAAWVQVELAWLANSEEAAVGRFVAFMRDAARSRGLL